MVGDQAGKGKIEHIRFTAPDIKSGQIQKIKDLFPEAVVEGKVNFETLKQSLGEALDDRKERYFFTWAGKQQSIKILQRPGEMTLKPDRSASIDFDNTKNVFIEGENLEVLKLLYKAYFGRVKMIYIDPPYNTGKEFIYPDDYVHPLETYLKLTGQKDENGNALTSNPETSGRYHSAWLSMMYPRLFIARQLLRDDGVIFVSIDDHEVHNLRMIMNEIFGEENFLSQIIWFSKYTVSNDTHYLSQQHEYVLFYAKNKEVIEKLRLSRTDEMNARYSNPDDDPRGPWKATPLHAKSGHGESYTYTFKNGVSWKAPQGRYPRFSINTLSKLEEENKIWFGKDGTTTPSVKTFLSEVGDERVAGDVWHYDVVGHTHSANEEFASVMSKGIFDNPKPCKLIRQMIELTTNNDKNEIILDFFGGSGTTAQAVIEQNAEDNGNRKFIIVQMPEPTPLDSVPRKEGYQTIADIGKERIRRVINRKKNAADRALPIDENDLGFKAFKLAPSNFRIWQQLPPDTTAEAYTKQLELFSDPLLEGFDPEDVIYEIALKEGFALTSRIENVPMVNDAVVYKVMDDDKGQHFYICMDDHLQLESLRSLDLARDDLFICRSSAIDDTTAANLAMQCRLKLI